MWRTFFGIFAAVSALTAQQVRVAKWPGDRRAAISLTFDDGMDTHLDIARPILKKHGLNGTFYVTTGREVWSKRLPEWKALAAEGNEIGNHTVWHPCLLPQITPHSQDFTPEKMERNVLDAARDIEEEIGGHRGLTFAYPCGNLTFGPPEEQAANTPRFFGYVAQCCFAARGYGTGGAAQDPAEMSVLNVTDLGITDSKSYIELLAMAEPALKAGTWGVFCFHGVGGEWLAISRETFEELASYLERHREIWTATFGDAVRYIQERKALGIEMVRADTSAVELALKWPLDRRIYDVPLTLKVDFGGGRTKLVDVPPGTARMRVER